MVASRACEATRDDGQACSAVPPRDGDVCLWHDPEHGDEVAKARRLGGLRRRRETAVAGAYSFEGLETTSELRRLLEIAVTDVLGLENSVARAGARRA